MLRFEQITGLARKGTTRANKYSSAGRTVPSGTILEGKIFIFLESVIVNCIYIDNLR